MMAYLQGNVLYHGVGYVIVENGGIGLETRLFVSRGG